MSRKIDVTDPENLSEKDRAYLASRGRTPEQEADRQHLVELKAQRIAEQVETYQRTMTPEDMAYRERTARQGINPGQI
ncbi:hypothetical protein [Pseudonocardia sp. WMMC193]|uniref:hypothetical protein n=1 Tax=Pseudonocardia sp. WMMC193 TaxID=2911965 RepID=UPI001F3550B8|nr:hypothetical protein [Pseudonocardia sp. WMMC193]MCF7552211.1 hypothetical protein [Pseudonocardia sp. WMMC193]